MLLDLGTLFLFREAFGLHPTLGVAINQIVVVVYSFTLNKYWSFKNHEMPHRQFVRFLLVFLWNYLFAVTFMYIGHDIFHFDYLPVRLVSIILSVSWNFVLYKKWVYKTTMNN